MNCLSSSVSGMELHVALGDNAVGDMVCGSLASCFPYRLYNCAFLFTVHECSLSLHPWKHLCHFDDIHCTRDEMIYHLILFRSSDDMRCCTVSPMDCLEKWLVRCFVDFQTGLYGLLLLAYLISLYILVLAPYQTWLADNSLPVFCLMVSFTVQKPFRLRSHLLSFLGLLVILELCFKMYQSRQISWSVPQ